MKRKGLIVIVLAAVAIMAFAWPVAAADFISQPVFRVPEGEIVNDDLYITGSEIYINGEVSGDLFVVGGYVEINGRVSGDVLVVAGGIRLTEGGEIGDDARLLVGGAELAGRIGGDLIVSSGGAAAPLTLNIGEQAVLQGGNLQPTGQVGQEAIFYGGLANVAGKIGGDLTADVTAVIFDGQVDGRATFTAQSLEFGDNGRIKGELAYTAPERLTLRDGLAKSVSYTPPVEEEDFGRLLGEALLRVVSALLGFALLGWLIIHWRPQWLARPVSVMAAQPLRCVWVGFMVSILFLFFPLATVFLALGTGLFWGFGSGLIVALAIIFVLAAVWIFSPLLASLWLGFRFSQQPLSALLIGAIIIVPLTQIQLLGGLISSFCFVLSLGGLVLSRSIER